MTGEDLKRFEAELAPLVPLDGAPPLARADALAFNADASDVKAALLDPAQRMLEKGLGTDQLSACLERTVAQLAFWRRVLLKVHRGALRAEETPPGFLVGYLLSEASARSRSSPAADAVSRGARAAPQR